jgi:nuclear transcription factor Y gamma
MKLDEDVKMISAETPLLISKACELFIIELAYRGWIHTIESNRRTLQRNDIAQAISHNDFYDFLLDIVEESCKNKLFYSAHSYSKNPSVPLIGLFDNYQINVNNNINNNLDQSNNNIINNFNNLINLDESYLGRINNKNSKNTKNYVEENNNKNNKDYNLNQSDFLNFKLLDSSKNTNLNLYFK